MSENDPKVVRQIVEDLFKGFNLDASLHLMSDNEGRTVWGLQRGSAQLYIIHSYDLKSSWLQVISPILSLPAQDKRLECYEHMLELNAKGLINCAFGIEEGKICISSDRSTKDLQLSELQDMVLCVSAFADDYDDKIATKFGCELLGEKLDND